MRLIFPDARLPADAWKAAPHTGALAGITERVIYLPLSMSINEDGCGQSGV